MPNSLRQQLVFVGVLHVELQEGHALRRPSSSLRIMWRSTEVLPVVAGPAQMASFMLTSSSSNERQPLARQRSLSRRRESSVVQSWFTWTDTPRSSSSV